MKNWIQAFRMLVFMTVLTGIAYPLLVTGIAQVIFPDSSQGSLLKNGNQVVGSVLIAQKFEKSEYFWARPSAGDYNPLPSGGSNQGQISAALKTAVDERLQKLKAAHPGAGEPPQDLLFASASGLDPHISPAAAKYQVGRVALSRSMDASRLQELVDRHTEGRQFGILGEPRVNVLVLNMALDQSQK